MENGSFHAELNGFRINSEVRGRRPVLMTLPNSWGLTRQRLRGLCRFLEAVRDNRFRFAWNGGGASGLCSCRQGVPHARTGP